MDFFWFNSQSHGKLQKISPNSTTNEGTPNGTPAFQAAGSMRVSDLTGIQPSPPAPSSLIGNKTLALRFVFRRLTLRSAPGTPQRGYPYLGRWDGQDH